MIDLASVSPQLGATCQDYLSGYRRELEADIRGGAGGVSTVCKHARILDGLLGALYCAADAATRPTLGAGPVSLVAVGGYGRSQVGLHSDVDLLFLCHDPTDPRVAALAEALLYPVWDLGIEIGHVVRGVDETIELATEDIRTATTLLDLRCVAGDRDLVNELQIEARKRVFQPHINSLLDALLEDTMGRHDRFGGSLFRLEPDVKLGRGGLRDLDVATWAARARWNTRTVEDFVRTGALLAREVVELDAARELLWRVRNLLHLRARRRNDRLTFADQEEIASELGFEDGLTLGVEQFMQAYYRNARVVAQTAERMLERARPRVRRKPPSVRELEAGLLLFDGMVTFNDSSTLEDDPSLALRLYAAVVAYDRKPYGPARDAIARVAVDPSWRESLRHNRNAHLLFLELLTHVGEVSALRHGSIVEELHEVGLLCAMLPEMEPLTGRIQYDTYHLFTVDVHALHALDRLRALRRGEVVLGAGFASRLARECQRLAPLFLATLLHDVGKVKGSAGHHRRGAEIARVIALRLGMSAAAAEEVGWLIQEHGSLYHWATRRDTTDSATIEELSHLVGTKERLTDLYLLTVSVMSTLNPSALSGWKAALLEDLYFTLVDHMEAAHESCPEERANEARAEVIVGFVGDAGERELEQFVRAMPDRYLLANPVDTIRQHARAARARGDRPVHVTALPGPSPELSELLVLTDDRPGLLADLASVLVANRLEVLDAQIYTRPRQERDEAFDIFLVRRKSGEGEVESAQVNAVRKDLNDLFDGRLDEEALRARRPSVPPWLQRRGPEVRSDVRIDNDSSMSFTVVDVMTRDRPGLLQRIARVLFELGLTIGLSKINTEGDRAVDVFYVRHATGEKIQDADELARLRRTLLSELAAFAAEEES